MAEPTLKYCPMCATPLVEKEIFDAKRPACPACGFVYFLDPKVVAVVVVEHAGKILLGKRNINPGKGLWSFPGGYVNRGEKVEDAAVREIKEETNLDVQLAGLVGLYSANGSPHVLAVYRASVTAAEIATMVQQDAEVTELAFFSPDATPELAFQFESQILVDWSKQNAQQGR